MYVRRQACAVTLLWVPIALTVVIGCKPRADNEPKRPADAPANPHGIQNVILISIDTLRADHLACYGHDFVRTPNIDALADEGILFTQHIAAASTTLASHTSMMTGTYPHTHGVVANGYHVNDKNVMLAEVLQAAGFITAGFIGAIPLDTRVNFHQGFAHYDTEFTWGEGYHGGQQRRANEVTDAVLAWLGQRGQNRRRSTAGRDRLFVFIHYFDPHSPYTPPAPFARMYRPDSPDTDGSMEVIENTRDLLRSGYRWYATQSREGSVQSFPPDVQAKLEEGYELALRLDAEYGAEITFCDHHVGRLLDELNRQGFYDNSLIIITSDHGETMHEHFNAFNHGQSVYETEIHIPLIMRFPKAQYAGQRISRLVSNIDLAPTILALLALPLPQRVEGGSFAGVFDGVMPPRGPVFAEATQPWNVPEFHNDPVWPNRLKFHGIRTPQYKYMFRIPDRKSALFDLSLDPTESMNLLQGGREYDPAALEELRTALVAWWNDAHPFEFHQVTSKDHLEALRSLGYVGD